MLEVLQTKSTGCYVPGALVGVQLIKEINKVISWCPEVSQRNLPIPINPSETVEMTYSIIWKEKGLKDFDNVM